MKKRAKLSLTQPREGIKKRPNGFKGPPPPNQRPVRLALREQSASSPPPSKARSKATEQTRKQPLAWLRTGTIAKALLVVGAAAISIYLLKTRLF